MDDKNFKKMMEVFMKVYEKPLKPDILKIYKDLLQEIPDNQVEYITEQCLKNCKYFPKPADIFEYYEKELPKLE